MYRKRKFKLLGIDVVIIKGKLIQLHFPPWLSGLESGVGLRWDGLSLIIVQLTGAHLLSVAFASSSEG